MWVPYVCLITILPLSYELWKLKAVEKWWVWFASLILMTQMLSRFSTLAPSAVLGSSGSGLCPTRNRPVRDQVSKNPTRNRPIKRFGFRGLDVRRVGSVSGEAETHRKPLKISEISPDLARSGQDPVRSSQIWQRFLQIR